MPSTEPDPPGDAYRVLVAVYLTVPVVGAGAVALAARGTTLRTGAVVVLLGGLATLAVAGAVVGLSGVPRPLRPRRLYASGWAWLPGAVGAVAVVGALPVALAVDGAGPPLLAALTGVVLAGVGGLVRFAARNAEARARLAGSETVIEWQTRPAPTRRRLWYAASAALALPLLAGAAWLRDLSLVGVLGLPVAVAAQGANERQYRLTGDTLVYGNPQVWHLLDRETITGVTHGPAEIRIERRGWRPALTCATAEMDDPEAVVTALTQVRGERLAL
jgi:hypothetical protein